KHEPSDRLLNARDHCRDSKQKWVYRDDAHHARGERYTRLTQPWRDHIPYERLCKNNDQYAGSKRKHRHEINHASRELPSRLLVAGRKSLVKNWYETHAQRAG